MSKIPNDIIQDLQNKLNLCVKNNSCKSFYDAADILEKLRNNFHTLDSNRKDDKLVDTALILRSILFPFAVKTIQFKSEIISQKMISFILWWIKKKPEKAPSKQIFEALAEKRVYKLEHLKAADCLANRHKLFTEEPLKQTGYININIDYIFTLFDIKTFGQDCDDLISLIMWLIKEKVEGKIIQTVFNTNISEIWLLYFDPLCIEQVPRVDINDLNEIIGQQDLHRLSENIKLPVMVHWSDNRSDMISSKSYRRERIDDLVYYLVDISTDDNCLELLKSIPHEKILSSIETCTNESVKSTRKAFLSKQFIFLIKTISIPKENEMSKNSLFNQMLDVLTSYYQNLLNTIDFVIPIISMVIEYPSLFQTVSMTSYIRQFGKILTEFQIIEIINSLFAKLATKVNNEDLFNLLCLTNMIFDDLSNCIIQSPTTLIFSFEWFKSNFDQILESDECQEIIHKLIKHLFCVLPSVTFIKLLKMYLETNNPLYMIYLSISVTQESLKVVRENFDDENFSSLNEALIKLVDAFSLNEESENLRESVQTLISFLLSCSNIIRENSNLIKKFYQKSFIEFLIQLVYKFKQIEKIGLKTSMLNFILNSISYESYFREVDIDAIVEQIINDADTFGGLLNSENMFLLLNLLFKKKAENVKKFICNIINLIESNETSAQKCFTSLLQVYEKLSENLKSLIDDKLKEHIGIFIDLLSQKDFKKISIKFLCKLLDFNDEEKRILDSYYGLNELNKTKSEQKLENREEYLFFTTETLQNQKKRTVKNDADEVMSVDIRKATSTLDYNLNSLKEKNQLKIDPLKNTDEFEKIKNSLNFVWTETTRANLNKILQGEVSPILLEGGTGIGKSATIQVAADITNNKLIRFNMSSKVTIDDLLGKVTIIKDIKTNEDTFKFQPSPFAIAFKKGYWLLLDEMNLAPDNVLQSIENALDSETLILHNPCDSTKSIEIVKKDPKFRLFATQNPSVGFFKGKREKLSQSLLDRFTIYYFDELPTDEWVEIAKKQLEKSFARDEANNLSQKIVLKIHMSIKLKINEKEFQEKAAYAEITIRDLFKLCERLVFLNDKKYYNTENSNQILSFCAFLTYGARFRDSGRGLIIEVLKKNGFIVPNLDVNEKYEISLNKVTFEDIVVRSNKNETSNTLFDSISKTDIRYLYLKKILSIHENVKKECFSKNFISEHGLYLIENSWIVAWFNRLENEKKKEDWDKIGFIIYSSKFRHEAIRKKIRIFFKNEFNVDFDLTEVNKNIPFTAVRPFVVTERVLKVWKQIGWNLDSSYPILLSGSEGCGKSETIYALAKLLEMEITQVCLTPETESSHLVGQYSPNEGTSTGEKILWQDGFVTRAFKKGSSVLLDNLNQGDSCVLERLNPLLENEPIWVLTEKTETVPLEKKETFKVFATMTVTNNSSNKSFYPELSPAFYNRFSIIHMENNSLNDEKSFKKEINFIAKCLLDTDQSNQNCVELISNVLWLIHNEVNLSNKKPEYGVVTMRNYIRFIDMFFILSIKNAHKNLKPQSVLFKCYKICFEGQVKIKAQDREASKKSSLYEKIKKLLGISNDDFYLKDNYKFDEAYVLTESRTEFVETVLACIECKIPVLLEGKHYLTLFIFSSHFLSRIKTIKVTL